MILQTNGRVRGSLRETHDAVREVFDVSDCRTVGAWK